MYMAIVSYRPITKFDFMTYAFAKLEVAWYYLFWTVLNSLLFFFFFFFFGGGGGGASADLI